MIVLSLLAAVLIAQQSQPAPPALRLGNTVVPTRYSLTLQLDPDKEDFSGIVEASVDVREAVKTFWVNSAPTITISSAEVEISGGRKVAARILKGGDDFAGFAFDDSLPVGPATLRIVYAGKLDLKSSNGIFRGKTNNENYIYTQFEPIAARSAFPCFDEPQFKVPWQLTLEVPKQMMAVANTPVVKEEMIGAASSSKRLTFAATKPIPSYLVAFGVGPFEVVEAGVSGRKKTPVRIIVPKGRTADAAYAKEVTPKILAELENYFDIPYPYEKLDELAVPLFGGAMENPGLVTYADTILLSEGSKDSVFRQRGYFVTAAHELAHQWFGDLVTMSWWNDTWLNESFATWMESRITDKMHPDWRNSVEEINGHLNVMRQDSLISARRIRQPVESNSDINDSFDGITYIKGGAVIRMLETWMGEKAFQKGVQYHMNHHAFGSATAEDFFASLATATKLPIAAVASTFIDQSGVPLVNVALDCTGKGAKVSLKQKRFLPMGTPSPDDRTWKIPVCVKYPGGRECSVLDQKESSLTLKHSKGCPAWVLANPELGGYYHVQYEGDLLQRLTSQAFAELSVPEKVSLVGDAAALTTSGGLKPSQALVLAERVKDAPEHELVETAVGIVFGIDRLVPKELRPNMTRYVQSMFGERGRKLGWVHNPGDDEETKISRASLVPLVAAAGEDAQLAEQATKLVTAWLTDHSVLPPDLTAAALSVVARRGGKEWFDRFLNAAKNEKDPRARQRLIGALGSSKDPELIRAAEQLYLDGAFDARESWPLLFASGGDAELRRMPWEFVTKNIDVLEKKVTSTIVGGDGGAVLVNASGGFCSEAERAEVEAFFGPRVEKYTGGKRALAQRLERIHLCAVRMDAQSADVVAFLKPK